MKADLDARKSPNAANGDNSLSLSFQTIESYHASVFNANGLQINAWTPYYPFLVYADVQNPKNGNWTAANTEWLSILGKGTIGATWSNLVDLAEGVHQGDATYAQAQSWLATVVPAATAHAGELLQANDNAEELSLRNADYIDGWKFDPKSGDWYQLDDDGTSGHPIITFANATEAQELNQEQQARITEFGSHVLQYKDLDQRVTDEPALKGELDKSQQLYALKWLRAPVSGLVQKVDVTTVGQVVTPAQSLVTIVPDGTPLVVEATVSNEDIGYLKVGQQVEVKVDTFPFQRYGSLKGTLVSISPDAEDKNAAARDTDTRAGAGNAQSADPTHDPAATPNTGYVYKVRIHTEDSHFVVDGEPRPVLSGMTVQADITTDRRRVIDFFLSPVVRYLDEGMKVR